jgi:tetratricopeptide (TPR) repeat protein
MCIGQYYFKHHQPQEALKHFEAAAQLGADIGDPRHEGYPLMGAGASHNYLGNAERAGQAYRRASQLMKSAYAVNGVVDEHIAQADALTLLAGSLEQQLENHDEVILCFQLAEGIYQHHASLASLSKLLMSRASFHWRKEQFSHSAHDYEQARKFAQQEGLQAREAAALASLGAVYRRLERYDDSIQTSLEALKNLKQVDDQQAEAFVLSSLAESYRLSAKLAEAQSCLLRSLELREGIGDTDGAAIVLAELDKLSYDPLVEKP